MFSAIKNLNKLKTAGFSAQDLQTLANLSDEGIDAKEIMAFIEQRKLELSQQRLEIYQPAQMQQALQEEFDKFNKRLNNCYKWSVIAQGLRAAQPHPKTQKISHFYNYKEESDKYLSPLLKVADFFSETAPIKTRLGGVVHPITPDYLFDLDIEKQEIKTTVYFQDDYVGPDLNGKSVFSTSWELRNKINPIFAKDLSILQLAAMCGAEEIIEKCVVFGCNIDYVNPMLGKKAIDLYVPSADVAPQKVQYIENLLEGINEGEQYRALWQKKMIDKTLSRSSAGAEVKIKNHENNPSGVVVDLSQQEDSETGQEHRKSGFKI